MNNRLTPQALADALEQATREVAVGARYRHYKGQEYTVVSVAIDEASQAVVVVYRAEYDGRLLFVRPLVSWLEDVELDGRRVKRFALRDSPAGFFESGIPGK